MRKNTTKVVKVAIPIDCTPLVLAVRKPDGNVMIVEVQS